MGIGHISPEFYFVDGEEDIFIESERKAQDAKVKLDGFEFEVPDNRISTLIPGLTIELKKAAVGEEFSIVVSEDTKKITGKIEGLVNKINSILKFINAQNDLDSKSDVTRTLGGDLSLTIFESRLRSVIFKTYQTKEGGRRFGDLGVAFQKNGQITLNKEKFESALSDNFTVVNELLNGMITGDGIKMDGFIDDLTRLIEQGLRSPDGIVESRKRGIQGRIDQIDRRIDQRKRIIEQKERNLKDKFAKLEGTISRIKTQGAGLQALSGGMVAPSIKIS